jgi:hypothetical protein
LAQTIEFRFGDLKENLILKNIYILVCSIWLPSYLPKLSTGIDSGMALTPFPFSIGLDLNP